MKNNRLWYITKIVTFYDDPLQPVTMHVKVAHLHLIHKETKKEAVTCVKREACKNKRIRPGELVSMRDLGRYYPFSA